MNTNLIFRKNNFRLFLLLALTGLLLRGLYLFEFSHFAYFDLAIGADVGEYDSRAEEILKGILFPFSPEIHAPLYSFFLAALKKMGANIVAVRIIQTLLNYISWIALFFLLEKKEVPEKIRFVFLGCAMVLAPLIFHQAEIISEALLLPLATLLFFLFHLSESEEKKQKIFTSLGAGLCGALLLLTHGMMAGFLLLETVYLGYSDARLGMAASCGYLFAGCSEEALRRGLPYLTYLAVAEVALRGGEVHRLFNGEWAVNMARRHGKVPILRVFLEGCSECYRGGDSFADLLIELAREGGYAGLALSVPEGDVEAQVYEEFILNLRKRMIGSGLILFCEAVCDRDHSYADLADGCVLSCAPPADDRARRERRAFEDFAEEAESSKTFVDITSFAVAGGEYLDYMAAVRTAAKVGAEIRHNAGRGVCEYRYRGRGGEEVAVEFESLENIKAKLDLVGELGYMGISFDVGRTPIAHLMAYSALFSGIGYTSIFGQI